MRWVAWISLGWLGVTVMPCAAGTFTVINTNDTGAGSLRAAITSANATPGGTNLIQFNIPPLDGTVKTISPPNFAGSGGLPTITFPVIIDGYTQDPTHSHPNTLTNGDDAVLLIEISGAASGGGINPSLQFGAGSGGSTLRGLIIDNGFTSGPLFTSRSNTVEGCFLGVDPTGRISRGTGSGVAIQSGDASFSRIGGATPAARNIIAGNDTGIVIYDGTNCVVEGNFIGLDVTGTNALPNNTGLDVRSRGNLIGGTNAAAGNIIAGDNSTAAGIAVFSATGNFIQGNFIGTDVTGAKRLAFGNTIRLFGATATQVGGLTPSPGGSPRESRRSCRPACSCSCRNARYAWRCGWRSRRASVSRPPASCGCVAGSFCCGLERLAS